MTVAVSVLTMTAQTTAKDVIDVARKANDYFMAKYSDPTLPTNVKKIRPSSLWTRAVYYEGLMALYEVDNDPRYIATAGPHSTNGRPATASTPATPTTNAAARPI